MAGEEVNDMESRAKVERLRRTYPSGVKVELLEMDDPQAPPTGTLGEVIAVDDAGQIIVRWQTGSSLSLIPGVDSFRIVRSAKGGST